jgi:hypothetical protein
VEVVETQLALGALVVGLDGDELVPALDDAPGDQSRREANREVQGLVAGLGEHRKHRLRFRGSVR